MLTAEDFKKMTGREPENDDLERVNCSRAGNRGHIGCGVCRHNKPAFECGICFLERLREQSSYSSST